MSARIGQVKTTTVGQVCLTTVSASLGGVEVSASEEDTYLTLQPLDARNTEATPHGFTIHKGTLGKIVTRRHRNEAVVRWDRLMHDLGTTLVSIEFAEGAS